MPLVVNAGRPAECRIALAVGVYTEQKICISFLEGLEVRVSVDED
jgi:hypothetical protein